MQKEIKYSCLLPESKMSHIKNKTFDKLASFQFFIQCIVIEMCSYLILETIEMLGDRVCVFLTPKIKCILC
jgi:hypothetical protein